MQTVYDSFYFPPPGPMDGVDVDLLQGSRDNRLPAAQQWRQPQCQGRSEYKTK